MLEKHKDSTRLDSAGLPRDENDEKKTNINEYQRKEEQ